MMAAHFVHFFEISGETKIKKNKKSKKSKKK